MQKIIYKMLIITKFGIPGYQNHCFGDKELGLLDAFLQDNLLGFPERILEWLENPDVLTGGNATTLYPEDGKIVIRYEWWNEDDPEEADHKYETTAPQLIDAIHQWLTLEKTGPDAILIEQDDTGNITMRSVAANEIEAIRKLIKPNQ